MYFSIYRPYFIVYILENFFKTLKYSVLNKKFIAGLELNLL